MLTLWIEARLSWMDPATSRMVPVRLSVLALTCAMDAAISLIDETRLSAELATDSAWLDVSRNEPAS